MGPTPVLSSLSPSPFCFSLLFPSFPSCVLNAFPGPFTCHCLLRASGFSKLLRVNPQECLLWFSRQSLPGFCFASSSHPFPRLYLSPFILHLPTAPRPQPWGSIPCPGISQLLLGKTILTNQPPSPACSLCASPVLTHGITHVTRLLPLQVGQSSVPIILLHLRFSLQPCCHCPRSRTGP